MQQTKSKPEMAPWEGQETVNLPPIGWVGSNPTSGMGIELGGRASDCGSEGRGFKSRYAP